MPCILVVRSNRSVAAPTCLGYFSLSLAYDQPGPFVEQKFPKESESETLDEKWWSNEWCFSSAFADWLIVVCLSNLGNMLIQPPQKGETSLPFEDHFLLDSFVDMMDLPLRQTGLDHQKDSTGFYLETRIKLRKECYTICEFASQNFFLKELAFSKQALSKKASLSSTGKRD